MELILVGIDVVLQINIGLVVHLRSNVPVASLAHRLSAEYGCHLLAEEAQDQAYTTEAQRR